MQPVRTRTLEARHKSGGAQSGAANGLETCSIPGCRQLEQMSRGHQEKRYPLADLDPCWLHAGSRSCPGQCTMRRMSRQL